MIRMSVALLGSSILGFLVGIGVITINFNLVYVLALLTFMSSIVAFYKNTPGGVVLSGFTAGLIEVLFLLHSGIQILKDATL